MIIKLLPGVHQPNMLQEMPDNQLDSGDQSHYTKREITWTIHMEASAAILLLPRASTSTLGPVVPRRSHRLCTPMAYISSHCHHFQTATMFNERQGGEGAQSQGEGQFITSKGASKRKTRHKPNPPKQKGPHQLWSHRRKPDHYKDPRPGGGPPPAWAQHYQPPQLRPA